MAALLLFAALAAQPCAAQTRRPRGRPHRSCATHPPLPADADRTGGRSPPRLTGGGCATGATPGSRRSPRRAATAMRRRSPPRARFSIPISELDDPALPAGDYLCRTVKLGSREPGRIPSFSADAAVPCRIGAIDARLTFAQLDGAQRPIGRLYLDNDLRLVFLGTLQLTDETARLSIWRRCRPRHDRPRPADRRAALAPRPAAPGSRIPARRDRAHPAMRRPARCRANCSPPCCRLRR